jgi:hypothetical protein
MSVGSRVSLFAAAAAGAVLLGLSAAPAQAQQVIPGSWGMSCRDGNITSDVMRAECRTVDGRWRYSQIDLNNCRGGAIANADGYLVCESGYVPTYGRVYGGGPYMPGGTWAESCNNARLEGDDLVAVCRDRRGNGVVTRLDLDNCPSGPVYNNNGILSCGSVGVSTARNYAMPPGSWRGSCNDPYIEGDTLYAYCKRPEGGNLKTSIDLDRCPGMRVRNLNGTLVCEDN